MLGLLNLDKPSGMTSRDAVNRVQRLVRPTKIGHAGTLDPLAEGVLVLCLGQATRLISYVQRMPKTYLAEFQLGVRSDTEDIEGDVQRVEGAERVEAAAIEDALPRFLGTIEQVPPAYSAVKVRGRRAYAMARRGEQVELAARPIEVHRLELLAFDYPRFSLEIVCGSGTYVRSLGRDIARAVGSEAIMTALQRTGIGNFRRADACRLEMLEQRGVEEFLLPASRALEGLPRVVLEDAEVAALRQGRRIANRFEVSGEDIVAMDGQDRLVALLASRGGDRLLQPLRTFAS